MSKNAIMCSVFTGIILIVLSIAGFLAHSMLSKPQLITENDQIDEDLIVKNYIDSLFSANLESVYDMLYLKEKMPFNTKEIFIEKYKDDIKEIRSESMSIVPYESVYGGTAYTVTYKITDNPEVQLYEIELKGDKIFDRNLVREYCILDIPEGCTLYIDGILIDESYIIPKGDDRALNINEVPYCIPSVFDRTYQLKLTSPLIEDYTQDTMLYSISNFDFYDGFKAKKEIVEELYNQADQLIKEVYNTAFLGSTFDTINHYFTQKPDELETIKYDFENINIKRPENDYGLEGIILSNRRDLEGYSGLGYVRTSIAYDVEIEFTLEYVEKNRLTKKYEGERENVASIGFWFENGKWLCDSIDFYLVYAGEVLGIGS